MNEELQKALAALINKSVDATGNAIDWASAQLPGVLHQLLMWKAISSGIRFALSLAAIVAVLTLYVRLCKAKAAEENKRAYGEPFMVWFCGGVIILFPMLGLIATFLNSFDWLQILVAPKFYLIEYAIEFTKSAK